ncbi:MAG TPA: ATP-binding protein [Streptosporangiaceae bacterium]|nr:ATP-binding protein [Streptosporangiaceae bacterium]
MARPVYGIGKLGLRLAVAFLGVALASIIVLSYITEISTGKDINGLAKHQERALTRSAATAAGALYSQPPTGWGRANLMPVLDLITKEGAGAKVTDAHGNLIQATSGFGSLSSNDTLKMPVNVKGKPVGYLQIKFTSESSLSRVVRKFEAERLRASLGAAGIVALMALLVSLLVSRQITAPLERVLAVIRARGVGDRSVRIEDVRGTGVVHELSVALNESSDAIDQRDRLQRNLVANIAHELRTPVAILQASHEAMLDGVTPPTTENLWSLRDEVLRLTRMIEDLQRLASAEAAAVQLRLVPQSLADIADYAAGSLADSFGAAGIRLVRRLADVRVLCDPERMREVVVNLLTNALKFTLADGEVVLETGRDMQGQARLIVADTGIGIPPEELPRITERFFRGQRSAEMATGSGIGLTIVAELVRAQHGRLRITSQPGQGTQATITMPVTRKPVEPEVPELSRSAFTTRPLENRSKRPPESTPDRAPPEEPQSSAASASHRWA